MKAAIYDQAGPPEVLRYADVPDPVCSDDGLVIRVTATAIEGGDVINRATQEPPHSAYVVGYAAAGEIVEVGRDVHGFTVGQAVTTMGMEGSHAELRSVSAKTSWLIPEGLDHGAAAAIPIAFGTAHQCLHEAGRLREGETVLVQGGAGGVGIALIQLAKLAGARVIATVSGQQRTDRLKRLGLDAAIDYRTEDVIDAVRRMTDEAGVDLVVDPVGGRSLQVSVGSSKPHGRVVFVGNAGGGELKLDLWPAMVANLSLTGVFMGTLFERDSVYNNVAGLLAQAAHDHIEVVIDRRFALAEAAQAHRYIADNPLLGRVLLIP